MRRHWALFCVVALSISLSCANAETLRIATFNTELHRDGPGLLLRDIQRAKDPQIKAVIAVITVVSPDILALQGIDWDYEGAALEALANQLEESGLSYPYRFALRPNSGMATGLDMDGDGRLGRPRDAQGYGAFTGQGGLAILSRYPIRHNIVQDFTPLMWRDLPGAILPTHSNGKPFPSAEALAAQRLSSTSHWVVPIDLPNGTQISLLTFHAGPPVFDGPEDRNGRRNHDEIRFWRLFLDGKIGDPPAGQFVLAGGATLDPFDSEGRNQVIATLLNDSRLQDPTPSSAGATLAPDQGHIGRNALDTVDWPKPGRLRVDYVLPSRDLPIIGTAVHWPAPGTAGYDDAITASRHRLVWVDLNLD
ncbi:MAG: endonuclease/exonuclease/phosphatase family protein [Rhodobacteraceae bacterium]|nr:endonuclease/exonuclease/phosphatase family protein [Paracoccaceae bacterium]